MENLESAAAESAFRECVAATSAAASAGYPTSGIPGGREHLSRVIDARDRLRRAERAAWGARGVTSADTDRWDDAAIAASSAAALMLGHH